MGPESDGESALEYYDNPPQSGEPRPVPHAFLECPRHAGVEATWTTSLTARGWMGAWCCEQGGRDDPCNLFVRSEEVPVLTRNAPENCGCRIVAFVRRASFNERNWTIR